MELPRTLEYLIKVASPLIAQAVVIVVHLSGRLAIYYLSTSQHEMGDLLVRFFRPLYI